VRIDVLGVLGGMGPAATADFLSKLTWLTPVRRDQQHLRSIICSYPDIPDRTEAILSNGPSPLPAMLNCLALLQLCDVSCVAIPCNTAHYWFEELQRQSSVPILHIVDAVQHVLTERNALTLPVGLLATTATIRTGVYARRLAQHGVSCIVPEQREQARVMQMIRRIKSGDTTESVSAELSSVVASLRRRGAGAIILGCTELPLRLPAHDPDFIDSTAALALECIRLRRGTT
jgi:aspartate racemase